MTSDDSAPDGGTTDEVSGAAADGGEERSRSEEGRASPDGGAESDDSAVDRTVSDGGVALDPWGSATVDDYRNLFEEFGIEEFDAIIDRVPDPHYLMRRGVIFGHRGYDAVADAMRKGEDVAALSGFMPTGDPHIGHKLVFDELIYHQEHGADTYGLIADLEAHSARGMTWAEIDEHARDYLLSLLALGFDAEEGTLYRQSTNRELQDLAFELGAKARFAEFEGIYGFGGSTSVSHMQSVVTQMADILYPQVVDEPKPTVIPVGPDQDPHVRFSRDIAARTRYFKVTDAFASFELDDDERRVVAVAYDAREEYAADADTPRCEGAAEYLRSTREDLGAAPDVVDSAVEKLENGGKEPLRPRVRFFDRNATDEAFEALIGAVEGEKRVFEAHVDAFELDRAAAEELAREIEVDHDGFGFVAPSSIYHRFMTGLTGGKMSSSDPASHISLLDDPEDGYDKVMAATTGGRDTAEEQRELGGRADECPVYELYAYLLAGDDDDFAELVYDECVGGERLCGDCKAQAAGLMREFLAEHQEKREEAEELLEDLDIDLDVDASRRGVAPTAEE